MIYHKTIFNMLKNVLFFIALTGLLSGCGNKLTKEQAKSTDTVDQKEMTIDGQTFGESFTAGTPVTYANLMEQLQTADSVNVQFQGIVQEVCQAKGCWMTIASAESSDEMPVMVKFKDYGFFMPKDISGREVVMNGYAYKEVTPVDELRHYAEDAGKSQEEIEAITAPKEEYKFLASGVVLLDTE
jgi:hypothetical protein